jgi:uncharacterized protein YecT (DUF1311 family)
MKKQIQWLTLFCSTFILAGCLDLDQNITLVKDQLTYKAELKVDAKIAAFADKKQGGFCSDFGSSQNEGIVVDVKESADGGNIICAITAQGHVDKFKNFSSGDKNKSEMVRITEVDGNKYRIESTIDFQGKNEGASGMEGMLEAMLAGRNVSWSVSAPKVIESNGKIAEDGKSVTWSLPMSVAFKNPQKFYAVIQKETSWLDSIVAFFKKILNAIMGVFKSDAAPAAQVSSPVKTDAPVPTPKTEAPTAAAPASVDNNPFAPSFDCTKASSSQERMICGDRELSKLDVQMAGAYADARQKSTDANALKAEQKQWLKNTQRSCSDKACLVGAYTSRIAELDK